MDSVFQLGEGTYRNKRNEMADRLAKKAAMEDIGEIMYDKIPRETIITERKENGLTNGRNSGQALLKEQ